MGDDLWWCVVDPDGRMVRGTVEEHQVIAKRRAWDVTGWAWRHLEAKGYTIQRVRVALEAPHA